MHTSHSMDAYAYGNRRDPGDAFAYARGQPLLLEDGETLSTIRRPLDFMAVTDHAETFDVMYLCTDPEFRMHPYCRDLRGGSNERTALDTFRRFLLPVIAGDTPARSPLCDETDVNCDEASRRQWRRSQAYANAANAPCEFTAFVGSEWSATPNHRHWHRNLIFASDAVTEDVIDYVRYPDVGRLWSALDEQCRAEKGCDVITIPHNTNLSESGNFAIETDSDRRRAQRMRYERLIEVYQSKGSSECLAEHWDDVGDDCSFELLFPRAVKRAVGKDDVSEKQWQALRQGYARHLLSRGLEAYREGSAAVPGNPLQLGLIGSTDNHSATPGNTAEDNWKGDVWAWGDDPRRRFERMDYSPGGLVGVWAEQNTRRSLFQALKRRNVYGTSGTRIGLMFAADRRPEKSTCQGPVGGDLETAMGAQLPARFEGKPRFVVQASMDQVPLARIDIIKGHMVDDRVREVIHTVFDQAAGQEALCVDWVDERFDSHRPAYWYVRVLEQPRPRWSRLDCRQLDNCATVPDADKLIQERAWSSPIWHLP